MKSSALHPGSSPDHCHEVSNKVRLHSMNCPIGKKLNARHTFHNVCALQTMHLSQLNAKLPGIAHSGCGNLQVWDFNKPNAPSLGRFDIVTANHLSSKAKDLGHVLRLIHEALKEGGFLYLHEVTCPLGHLIWPESLRSDNRQYGVCCSINEWKELLGDAGFQEIMTARLHIHFPP